MTKRPLRFYLCLPVSCIADQDLGPFRCDLFGSLMKTSSSAYAFARSLTWTSQGIPSSGDEVAFSVVATGPVPLSYQWFECGVFNVSAQNSELKPYLGWWPIEADI